jgi:hypothetical protein
MMSKNRRTLILGLLATVTLVWSVVHHFGVSPREMAWLFAYSVMGVLVIMALAAIAVTLLNTLRSLLRRDKSKQQP